LGFRQVQTFTRRGDGLAFGIWLKDGAADQEPTATRKTRCRSQSLLCRWGSTHQLTMGTFQALKYASVSAMVGPSSSPGVREQRTPFIQACGTGVRQRMKPLPS
jgi:hypothetical protein